MRAVDWDSSDWFPVGLVATLKLGFLLFKRSQLHIKQSHCIKGNFPILTIAILP